MPTPLRERINRESDHPLRRVLGHPATVVWRTIQAGMRYRVMGLAAESAFFAVLSLPPLLFGLSGAIGYIAKTFSVATVNEFKAEILALAARVLTPDTVTTVIAPTLDDVLAAGRVDVISIGFVLALWSGSRAMSVFMDTVSIMYGHAGVRGIIRARALSLGVYLVLLFLAAFILPLVLAGPSLIAEILPQRLGFLNDLYWPTVLVGSLLALTSLYSFAVPIRRRWRADLPGALLTLLGWLAGSFVLRRVLTHAVGGASLYGPLSAPIALLMWLYVTSLMVLIGAAFNAAIETVWPSFSGISRREAEAIQSRTEGAAVEE